MYKLIREKDKLVKESSNILFIDFSESGKFKDKFEDIAVGRSLLMSPFTMYYTWLTTPITKIIVNEDNYWKFETENSIYELTKED